MDLGQKLKQARLEAGMSQRQLCGDTVTRNMLSLIENGSAQPSMDTLRIFAQRLGKPMSFFLEELAQLTDEDHCWEAIARGDLEQALVLSEYQNGPVWSLLRGWVRLTLAENAVAERRLPYARTLLMDAEEDCRSAALCKPELQRRRLLLLYRADPQRAAEIAGQLDDEELLLRAEVALAGGDAFRGAALLDSAKCRETDRWVALRAESCFAQGDFRQAAEYYQKIEDQSLRRLEQCYEKLGDYKMAYHYACLQRE